MKIENGWVETYFHHGVDVANRRVFLNDIDEESVGNVVKGIYLMDAEDAKSAIELFICSYGGSVEHTLGLYDILKTVQAPIHTFAYGVCMSAAPLLLAAGEQGNRWVSENTSFMTHPLSDNIEGKLADMQAALKYSMQLDETWLRLLVRHSNKDYRFWNAKIQKGTDWYFSSQEAIEYGLADSIWEEK